MENLKRLYPDGYHAESFVTILSLNLSSDGNLMGFDADVNVDLSHWNADQMKRFWEFIHQN